jgi:beta-fructofuranosidase
VTFELPDHWVWDFWFADDGERFHLFYLHAPKSLGHPDLRHRNARIGHATSIDLHQWNDHGPVLGPGQPGAFDGSATWTGSVVRDDDGLWRMFFTGSRFLRPGEQPNIETVGLAVSSDLYLWHKNPAPILPADSTWYETLADGFWHEEAWRDPWVFRMPDDDTWHMLLTARGKTGADARDRGVIGHAVSPDLSVWTVQPPLSKPGAGFAHLEVPQIADVDGRKILLFSCDSAHLTGKREGYMGGIWYTLIDAETGPYDTASARLLVDERLYAGKLITNRSGQVLLMGFQAGTEEGFSGQISDPIPLLYRDGAIQLATQASAYPRN